MLNFKGGFVAREKRRWILVNSYQWLPPSSFLYQSCSRCSTNLISTLLLFYSQIPMCLSLPEIPIISPTFFSLFFIHESEKLCSLMILLPWSKSLFFIAFQSCRYLTYSFHSQVKIWRHNTLDSHLKTLFMARNCSGPLLIFIFMCPVWDGCSTAF